MVWPVTNAITIKLEIESARALHLDQQIDASLGRVAYEKWAWGAWYWHPISGVFLLSLHDTFGYTEDTIFQVTSATYLGQACPVMLAIVG